MIVFHFLYRRHAPKGTTLLKGAVGAKSQKDYSFFRLPFALLLTVRRQSPSTSSLLYGDGPHLFVAREVYPELLVFNGQPVE
jgi:hypothetical protein